MTPDEKYESLLSLLKGYGRVAVAFSGGVDSSLLLYAAKDALGDDAIAITAHIHSMPEWELYDAKTFCNEYGVRHIILEINELEIEGFSANPPKRCYLCKSGILEKIIEAAGKYGMETVAEGSNLDDDHDYRPGFKAVKEQGVKSPLREAGFTKAEIRQISKSLGISVWNKQPCACLSSRIAYGDTITDMKLRRIEKAERFILDMGFSLVRVRVSGDEGLTACIEFLNSELLRAKSEAVRQSITNGLQEFGFTDITIDPVGYKTK